MGRAFLIAWTATLAGIVAVHAYAWANLPTRADATAGLLPGRVGWVGVTMAIPVIFSSRRLAKTTDPGAASFYVLPIFLGLGVLLFSMLAGYLPDAMGCVGIGRFGPLPPECMTPAPVRRNALVEAVLIWMIFGAMTVAWAAWRRRREARAATS